MMQTSMGRKTNMNKMTNKVRTRERRCEGREERMQTTCICKVSPLHHVHLLTTHVNRAMERAVSSNDNTAVTLVARLQPCQQSQHHPRLHWPQPPLFKLATPTKPSISHQTTMMKVKAMGTTMFVCRPQTLSFALTTPIKPSISHQTHAMMTLSRTLLTQCALTPVVRSLPILHHLVKFAATSIDDVHTDLTGLQGTWWSPMHCRYLGREMLISNIETFVKLASSRDFCI